MADWFETRFREPVDAGQLDPAFVARMRALVAEEWFADVGTVPSADTDPNDREGDIIMLDTEDRPSGREPANPRRPSPGRWLLVAAAAAVLAVVGALLVAASGEDDDPVDTAASPSTVAPAKDVMEVQGASEDIVELEPGRYFVDPDSDAATPLKVTYEVAAEGWSSWPGAVKFNDKGHTVVSIVTVDNLVTEACEDPTPQNPPVGPTVDDLATALSALSPFELTEPPTDVTLLGYQGKHLKITVPDLEVRGSGNSAQYAGCFNGNLQSWIDSSGEPFFGYNAEPGRYDEYWILDVDGTRLVISIGSSPAMPPEELSEARAIIDSIRVEL